MYVGNARKHYLINGIVASLVALDLTPSMAIAAEDAKIAEKTNK